MLRIDKSEKRLVRLTRSVLSDADHWERELQTMIRNDAEAFFSEIGESLLLLGEEVRPSDVIPDRIDLLAMDESGAAVVIELKRGTHKLQLLQAISYAGMVSLWSPDRFIGTLAVDRNESPEEARSAIEDHTGSDIATINGSQRIFLIAEDFDPALLISAEWLHDTHGVDIRCYRLQLSQENGNDYLTCVCVYPPIEIATLPRRPEREPGVRSVPWTNWEGALKDISSAAVRDFFTKELSRGQENRIRPRELVYRLDNKRRFWVTCRQEHAYVGQRGRFEGDEEFWKARLSRPEKIGQRHSGRYLRFNLVTPEDFIAFKDALEGDIRRFSFSEEAELNDSSPSED